MERTALVTGANGFVGNHLIRELAENDYRVIGVGGPSGGNSPDLHDYITADLTDADQVSEIDFRKVDAVIHLAAMAAVGPSFNAPMQYMQTNVGMEVNLFEAAHTQGSTPRFLVVSSGALYDATASLPIGEHSPVAPNSPYAISKLAQEQFAAYYNMRGFDCMVARPFNHIGPGQNTGFIVPDLTKQVVEAQASGENQVLVGNLASQRDYTDVRDIVRAYRLLIEKGTAGSTYNVCSGTSTSGQRILEMIMQSAGASLDIIQDPGRMRPSDTPTLYGSHERLTRDTGWIPTISLDTTIADVVADWRQRQ